MPTLLSPGLHVLSLNHYGVFKIRNSDTWIELRDILTLAKLILDRHKPKHRATFSNQKKWVAFTQEFMAGYPKLHQSCARQLHSLLAPLIWSMGKLILSIETPTKKMRNILDIIQEQNITFHSYTPQWFQSQ